MKKNIHPSYNTQATISCACGNRLITGSTVDETSVEICAACHPFYTGTEKLIDTRGRVEKFRSRAEKAAKAPAKAKIEPAADTATEAPAATEA